MSVVGCRFCSAFWMVWVVLLLGVLVFSGTTGLAAEQIRILALGDESLAERIESYRQEQAATVVAKDAKLQARLLESAGEAQGA